MKRAIIWAALPWAASHSILSLAADAQSELLKCSSIEDSAGRLACYDSAAIGATPAISVNQAGAGKWKTNIKTNPIDDSKTVVLTLDADAGVSSFGRPVLLVLRCQSNETELYITWDNYLGQRTDVLTRVGSSQPVSERWHMSSNSQASFSPRPIPLIKELIDDNMRLVAQTTPYNESPVTAIFNTYGIAEAIKPLRETCGW